MEFQMAFNGLSDKVAELFDMLCEECAEVVMIVSKIKRHGLRSYHPNDKDRIPNSTHTVRELKDVMSVAAKLHAEGQLNIDWREFTRDTLLEHFNTYKMSYTRHQHDDTGTTQPRRPQAPTSSRFLKGAKAELCSDEDLTACAVYYSAILDSSTSWDVAIGEADKHLRILHLELGKRAVKNAATAKPADPIQVNNISNFHQDRAAEAAPPEQSEN